MALISRFTRLFRADLHAVLDKIEEPALLLKQSIREMDEAVAADERQLHVWERERQKLAQKREQLERVLAELDEKCALCFQAGKDDLARALIRRKLESQQARQQVEGACAALEDARARAAQRLQERRAQLAAMQQKAEVLLDGPHSGSCTFEPSATWVRDEDVEVAYLFEKQKWSRS